LKVKAMQFSPSVVVGAERQSERIAREAAACLLSVGAA
jgi:hypothetical protein